MSIVEDADLPKALVCVPLQSCTLSRDHVHTPPSRAHSCPAAGSSAATHVRPSTQVKRIVKAKLAQLEDQAADGSKKEFQLNKVHFWWFASG